jgi:hypothetical protein
MRFIVVGMGEKQQNVHDLVIVVDRRNQSELILDIEDCYRPAGFNNSLISRRQHPS